MPTIEYPSPIGPIIIKAEAGKILYLGFGKAGLHDTPDEVLAACVSQLDRYFQGDLFEFDLPLDMKIGGTSFRIKVWGGLTKIPYGETRSYKDIAREIGNEKASRAVGSANHSNPISIIVPCHRVIGSGGKMVGYGGEIWRKEWLLEHEKKHAAMRGHELRL